MLLQRTNVNITRTGADKCKQMGLRIDPMEFMDTPVW